jgi:Tfp pilus assembly protein PilF
MKRVVAVLTLTFAALPLFGQVSELLEDGKQSDLRGKTIKAANKYEQALKTATSREDRVRAALGYAEALRGTRLNAQLEPAEASPIEAAYKIAVAEGTGELSFKAHNDYGVFLLDRGDSERAAQVFAEGEKDLGSVSPATAARYLYNLGLTRVRAKQPEAALVSYKSSLQNDPTFGLSAEAWFGVIQGFESAKAAPEATNLLSFLLDHKRYARAERYLGKALENEGWYGQSADIERFLASFARWAFEANAPFEKLTTEWLGRLQHVSERVAGEPGAKAKELVQIFVGTELPASFDIETNYFQHWRSGDEVLWVSHLLSDAADAFFDAKNAEQACARYIAAWRIDRSNIDSTTRLAEFLKNWKTPARARLLDDFTYLLFNAKAIASKQADTSAILRLNLVLGSIAESRNQWGPDWAPNTAAFQYRQAVQAYEALRASDAKAPTYPGVYSHLAIAYEHLGRKNDAWQQYVAAADANVHIGNLAAAQLMVEQAAAVTFPATPADEARLKTVTDSIAAAKGTLAPLDDSQIIEAIKQRLSAAPAIQQRQVDVSFVGGVATLRGDLGDDGQRIVALVKSTDGVKDVKIAAPPR